MEKKETKEKRKIPAHKLKAIHELLGLIERYSTVAISTAENMPSQQFQKIRHKLRDRILMKMIKKKMSSRVLEESKKEGIKELAKYIDKNAVIIFSNSDPFELATFFAENRYPIKAKPGQVANEDIVIEAGATDLMPGPAISELSAVGLKTGVEGGKISIKETKTIVKKNGKISRAVADVLMKLNILPFTIGLDVIAAYDSKDKKVYTNIKIDKEGFKNSLVSAYANARQFAIHLGYACKETISSIIAKAQREALALQKLTENKPSQESQSQGV